jgi:hypothetical protein
MAGKTFFLQKGLNGVGIDSGSGKGNRSDEKNAQNQRTPGLRTFPFCNSEQAALHAISSLLSFGIIGTERGSVKKNGLTLNFA